VSEKVIPMEQSATIKQTRFDEAQNYYTNLATVLHIVPDEFAKDRNLTQMDVARKFAEYVSWNRAPIHLRYCPSLGWLSRPGTRNYWEMNDVDADKCVVSYLDNLRRVASDAVAHNIDDAEQLLKYAKSQSTDAGRRGILSIAKSFLAVHADELDHDAYVLNTASGLVSLVTSDAAQVYGIEDADYKIPFIDDKGHILTKCAPFDPNDVTGWDTWRSFVTDVCRTADGQEDAEFELYLQMVCGMAAFGEVKEEGLWLVYGDGRNGKSTFFNAVSEVMGTYSDTINPDVLMDRQSNRFGLARIRGVRVLLCGELEEGQRLSTKILKRMTSTDPVSVERKGHDVETVQPTHSLLMYTNFLPRIYSTDDGTWRRIRVLPFEAHFDGKRKNYAKTLVSECGGAILRWIIQGALLFSYGEYALPTCKRVEDASARYRIEENWLQRFLDDCTESVGGAMIGSTALYEEYCFYCDREHERPHRRQEFKQGMERLGYASVHRSTGRFFEGVRLKNRE